MSGPGEEDPSAGLVFVLGVEHRSGTNLLGDLLLLHPWARTGAGFSEDFAVHHAGHLQQYVRGVTAEWSRAPGHDPAMEGELWAGLGAAVATVLRRGATPGDERVVVCRTPSVEHLPLVRRLFPRSPVLLLVRDGRAVAESLHRSFGWSHEEAIRAWRLGARRILAHLAAGPEGVKLVRYEDLVLRRHAAMAEVLSFLRWDSAAYDFGAADKLPVRGSSETRARDGRLHWEPVPADASFRPLERGADWPRWRRWQLAARAGPELAALGYDPGERPPAWAAAWFALSGRAGDLARGPLHRPFRAWQRRARARRLAR